MNYAPSANKVTTNGKGTTLVVPLRARQSGALAPEGSSREQ
jgi:hypothetical protein